MNVHISGVLLRKLAIFRKYEGLSPSFGGERQAESRKGRQKCKKQVKHSVITKQLAVTVQHYCGTNYLEVCHLPWELLTDTYTLMHRHHAAIYTEEAIE